MGALQNGAWPGEATFVSIGILAWNEEKAVRAALESLFQQSLFARLGQRGRRCEIVFVGNGCTDGTSDIVKQVFAEQARRHPDHDWFSCRQLDLQERGKINAWNCYVHHLAAPDAGYMFLMDADILIDGRDTLWNLLAALEGNPQAAIATDQPRKSISLKRRKTLFERFSLSASAMTRAGEAQLCAQLYCIRAETARRIYLPKDLSACEDGFIKTVVCTDFLTGELNPARIVAVPEASHTFEAYTSIGSILKNQKRQMIGQAIVHVLVD
ncbi:MAG: glycosyl transferase family 2, partial [Pedosphaera sp.]|nr:glycosyl transferase family 2 [Pedosphaera sp.]